MLIVRYEADGLQSVETPYHPEEVIHPLSGMGLVLFSDDGVRPFVVIIGLNRRGIDSFGPEQQQRGELLILVIDAWCEA